MERETINRISKIYSMKDGDKCYGKKLSKRKEEGGPGWGCRTGQAGQGRPYQGGTFQQRHEEGERACGHLVGRTCQAEGQKTKALQSERA